MPRGSRSLSVEEFAAKWRGRTLSERQAAHTHFIELCRVLGVAYPGENPADDAGYCFDARTATPGSAAYAAAAAAPAKDAGEQGELPLARIVRDDTWGFADVWKRGTFCWEYKRQGKHANLAAALRQLKEYKDSLDNPPLLIVCDIDRFEIHTNFTNYPSGAHRFTLEDLAVAPEAWKTERGESPLHLLRRCFTDPESFRPKKTVQAVTEERAAEVGGIAQRLGSIKANDPLDVAHFLMQLVFGFFAESVGLLEKGLLSGVLSRTFDQPAKFERQVRDLFRAMSTGGGFGEHDVAWFNGGLFREIDAQRFPTIPTGEAGKLSQIAGADWSAVEPSILGTLFERSLDPSKRSQIGAHYTSRDDILLIVDPVVIAPLRREWEAIQREAAALLAAGRAKKKIAPLLEAFSERLASVTVLDPACGSGNFLYVAIQQLLDLEKQLIAFGARPEIGVSIEQRVRPAQLRGIEINTYAAELARVSVWIGYLKWQRENGLIDDRRPILDALDTIENRDAIVDMSNPKKPKPAKWPPADFIIGNPPFLGSKVFRQNGLSDDYVEAMYGAFDLPKTSDLCCYWFELARQAIGNKGAKRVGLLATQAIRGGSNREVLERIKRDGDIFLAWSDREWVLDGAAVHVSMVGFDDGTERLRFLNGSPENNISATLATSDEAITARQLRENERLGFMGVTPSGEFEIGWTLAAEWLGQPNPNSRSNADVLRPWMNAKDMTTRCKGEWVIDFGIAIDPRLAAQYEAPFQHVAVVVAPKRAAYRTGKRGYWCFERPRPEMREALLPLHRYLATPGIAKHRLFTWLSSPTLPDHALLVFARSDDYFFGALHSCVHELWALRMGTQLESRPRYTPTTCFETFPFPWAPAHEPSARAGAGPGAGRKGAKAPELEREIAAAAKELNELRENWLNPPEWIESVGRIVDNTHQSELAAVPAEVRPLVRRSAIMASAAKDPNLKARTLTSLYNARPEWLKNAHERLDRAVLSAYAATDPAGEWRPEWATVYRDFGAGEIDTAPDAKTGKAKEPPAEAARKAAAAAARAPVDARIVANLLRLNGERAAG